MAEWAHVPPLLLLRDRRARLAARRLVTRALVLSIALTGCAAATDATTPAPETLVVAPSATPDEPSVGSVPTATLGAPLSGPPRLVLENHSGADLTLYSGLIVDEGGQLGTMALWPHPSDCPKAVPAERALPKGGVIDLAAPTHAFDETKCAVGRALPPGRYVVSFASGYGDDLYASAALTLPLTEPVRLKMESHKDPPACTPQRASRAARLVLGALREQGTPDALLTGCDAAAAVCGELPLPEDLPPATCTLTLHETLLRIRRPPGADQPTAITSWLDPEIVWARRPDVSRSTGAEVLVDGKRVVFEGVTQSHLHEHGGQAAHVASMQVRVHNASTRKLAVKVLAIDWLVDSSCGVPQPASPSPAVTGFEPSVLPPGQSELSIRFTQREAYQAHCDVFASRARLLVDGAELVLTSEHDVTRFDPIR